uniref:Sulfhydryl oxidase n=1 Tax=Pinguiococcus pyrenoidosus TaxID=172671 RepID=A0A7R9UEP7_9STRA|mmetsp:Transcript_8059/g.30257  ORF Transcript_8059/g.30257 Transcript_8059/m.30257 type:complete len:174 (+) Transcript_8059:669-1190(+)
MSARNTAEAALDCEEIACSSKIGAFRKLAMPVQQGAPLEDARCPPDREELGRSSWTLLHTTAAYYPERPCKKDMQAAKRFIEGFAALYPCSHCAEDFREAVRQNPPRVESREQFSLWACEQHNTVNEKLGKAAIPCTFAKLQEMWRTGSAACQRKLERGDELTPEETLGQDDT